VGIAEEGGRGVGPDDPQRVPSNPCHSVILIVLVCKQQKYSTDGGLHFISNIKQAVPFPVSKQLEQPGVEPEAALSCHSHQYQWGFACSAIFMSVLCKANCMCRGCTYIHRYQVKPGNVLNEREPG